MFRQKSSMNVPQTVRHPLCFCLRSPFLHFAFPSNFRSSILPQHNSFIICIAKQTPSKKTIEINNEKRIIKQTIAI